MMNLPPGIDPSKLDKLPPEKQEEIRQMIAKELGLGFAINRKPEPCRPVKTWPLGYLHSLTFLPAEAVFLGLRTYHCGSFQRARQFRELIRTSPKEQALRLLGQCLRESKGWEDMTDDQVEARYRMILSEADDPPMYAFLAGEISPSGDE